MYLSHPYKQDIRVATARTAYRQPVYPRQPQTPARPCTNRKHRPPLKSTAQPRDGHQADIILWDTHSIYRTMEGYKATVEVSHDIST